MTRTLRALGALLALLGLLVGVPAVLLMVGRLDALTQVEWARLLTAPVDGRLVVGLVSVLAWVAWLVVALTVGLEVAAVATRGRFRWKIPGTGWLREWVATLIVSLAALVLAGPMAAGPLAPTGAGTPEPSPETTSPATVEASAAVPADPAPGTRYAVRAGDDLWTLAEDLLGDGASWRLIADLNPWLDPSAPLEAGSVLVIPLSEPEPATEAPGSPPTAVDPDTSPAPPPTLTPPAPIAAKDVNATVTVRPGDTLWALAANHLGDPLRWPEIFALNTDQIADPDEIDIGWVLRLPPPEAAPPQNQPEAPAAAPEDAESAAAAGPAPILIADDAPITPAPGPASRPHDQADTATAVGADETPAEASREDHVGGLVAGIGGALALGVLGTLGVVRERQLAARPVGRRVRPASAQALRMAHALGRVAEDLPPPQEDVHPTAVVVGWDGDDAVLVDLEDAGVLHVVGSTDAIAGVNAAVSSSLLCADWSTGVEQVIAGIHDCWTTELDDPSVVLADLERGVTGLLRLVEARRGALGDSDLDQLRASPDLAVAWHPTVFVFCEPLQGQQRSMVVEACAAGVGVSAVLAHEPGDDANCADGATLIIADTSESGTPRATLDGRVLTPQCMSAPARRALIELFRSTSSTETDPAPWWSHADLPPNITPLRSSCASEEYPMDEASAQEPPRHPVLLMLGPLDIIGTRGVAPVRASRQCLEYCAWLLANPGRTPSAMAADLLVAETTRRSNMSRLRTWLGDDPSGHAYLPEAYSGRIQLHAEVTSDWEQFCTLTAPGVNRASVPALRRALALVRGAPLADAAPWQWQWAEQLRTDMISAIRDASVVVVQHALDTGDFTLATWSIARGHAASPEDELLDAFHAVVLYRLNQHAEAESVVRTLSRRARSTGVDLDDRTVTLLQEVVEGRPRARVT